jgi:hypothetical protein
MQYICNDQRCLYHLWLRLVSGRGRLSNITVLLAGSGPPAAAGSRQQPQRPCHSAASRPGAPSQGVLFDLKCSIPEVSLCHSCGLLCSAQVSPWRQQGGASFLLTLALCVQVLPPTLMRRPGAPAPLPPGAVSPGSGAAATPPAGARRDPRAGRGSRGGSLDSSQGSDSSQELEQGCMYVIS